MAALWFDLNQMLRILASDGANLHAFVSHFSEGQFGVLLVVCILIINVLLREASKIMSEREVSCNRT